MTLKMSKIGRKTLCDILLHSVLEVEGRLKRREPIHKILWDTEQNASWIHQPNDAKTLCYKMRNSLRKIGNFYSKIVENVRNCRERKKL